MNLSLLWKISNLSLFVAAFIVRSMHHASRPIPTLPTRMPDFSLSLFFRKSLGTNELLLKYGGRKIILCNYELRITKRDTNQRHIITIPVKSFYVKSQASVHSLHKVPRTKLCPCIFSVYRSKEFRFRRLRR